MPSAATTLTAVPGLCILLTQGSQMEDSVVAKKCIASPRPNTKVTFPLSNNIQ